MSTEITSASGAGTVKLEADAFAVDVYYYRPDTNVSIFHRDDFLAAVAKECDVIVIERSEMPPVEFADGLYLVDGGCRSYAPKDAADARRDGLALFAIADYLDAHPPVDEAQVEALADEIDNAYGFGGDSAPSRLIARYLVEQGWSK